MAELERVAADAALEPKTACLTYLRPAEGQNITVIFTEGAVTHGFWWQPSYTMRDGTIWAKQLSENFFDAVDLARKNGRTAQALDKLADDMRRLGDEAVTWFLPREAVEAVDVLPPGSVLQIQTNEFFIPWEILPHKQGKTWGETFALLRVVIPFIPGSEDPFSRKGVRFEAAGRIERLIVTSDAARAAVVQELCTSLNGPETVSRPSETEDRPWTYPDLISKSKGVSFLAILCHGSLEENFGQVLWLRSKGTGHRDYLNVLGCASLPLAENSTVVLASCHGGAGRSEWGGTSLAYTLARSRRFTVAASWANVWDISGAEVIKRLAGVKNFGGQAMATELRDMRNDLAEAGYSDVLAFGVTVAPTKGSD